MIASSPLIQIITEVHLFVSLPAPLSAVALAAAVDDPCVVRVPEAVREDATTLVSVRSAPVTAGVGDAELNANVSAALLLAGTMAQPPLLSAS